MPEYAAFECARVAAIGYAGRRRSPGLSFLVACARLTSHYCGTKLRAGDIGWIFDDRMVRTKAASDAEDHATLTVAFPGRGRAFTHHESNCFRCAATQTVSPARTGAVTQMARAATA
jgi:hypothetical protein